MFTKFTGQVAAELGCRPLTSIVDQLIDHLARGHPGAQLVQCFRLLRARAANFSLKLLALACHGLS